MDTLERLLLSIPWFAWIAIVAIVCSAITTSIRLSNTHAERLERIRMGMDPGRIPEA